MFLTLTSHQDAKNMFSFLQTKDFLSTRPCQKTSFHKVLVIQDPPSMSRNVGEVGNRMEKS